MLKLSFVILFLGLLTVYGQEKTISGSIKDTEGKPIPFANIIGYSKNDATKPITYGYSNEEGQFSLKISEELLEGLEAIILNITAIGFQEKTGTFQLTGQLIEIQLEESVTQLEEVIITPRKVTDTLSLAIHEMNLNKGSTLREMLNKTDGVIIGDEGGITYQGKLINKILINGKEVFINQNKVALDNLNYDIMANVQIINNYKDKFTIDFNRLRDPVINIETKEKFKGVFKGQIDAGTGYKEKYGLNGKGFFFSDILNVFATTNTNNVGEKELAQKDVAASAVKNATPALYSTLLPFFIEDSRTKKDFVSNSSLTARWEAVKSKTGLVFYHGNIKTDRSTDYSTFIADTLAQKSSTENTEKGNFISATLNHNRIFSEKMVLENIFSAMLVSQKSFNKNLDTLYIPETITFTELNENKPENFTISNALQLTHLLNENTAFELKLDYFNERNTRNFDTRLTNINFPDIFQKETSSKQLFYTYAKMKLKLKKASLNTGVELTKNIEKGDLEFKNNTYEDANLKRDVVTVGLPLSLNGSIKKLDYSLSVTPTLIYTEQSDNRHFFKMNHSLTYNFKTQNNLGIEVDRSYHFYNLNELFDTIVRSYNQKITNNRENIDRYATKNEVSLRWSNNNIARSKSYYFVYRYNHERNFLQTILDSVSNNVFNYSNKVFDKKETHSFNSSYRKGFYFGKAYHSFNITGRLRYNGSNYTTTVNNSKVPAKSSSWNPSFKLDFQPRNLFIKEISNNVDWNYSTFWLNNEKVNQQSVITNTFTVKGHGDKSIWDVNFVYSQYDIEQDIFNVPDLHFSYKYDISDTLSFSLIGKSLLTLFQLNNYNFVNTISDGNTLTQIRTANNLGYLIFYTSFKF